MMQRGALRVARVAFSPAQTRSGRGGPIGRRGWQEPHGTGHGHAALPAEPAFLGDPEEFSAPVTLPRVVGIVATDHPFSEVAARVGSVGAKRTEAGVDVQKKMVDPSFRRDPGWERNESFRRSSSWRGRRTP